MNDKEGIVFVCSDSVGETAEMVVRAVVRQFSAYQITFKRYSHIRSEDEITAMMYEASRCQSFVAYTLVMPELREMIKQEAARLGVTAIDIMGPVMNAFIEVYNDLPKRQPGLLHQINDEYFRRVEAIEFTVKCDDGKDMSAFSEADLVLLGVSRTSKTPLSIYLAHKGFKVCNYPIVPEVQPPLERMQSNRHKLIGLTMNEEQLAKIRFERLKSMGLPSEAKYASIARVAEELEYADGLYKKLGCPVIDVTERAIEETAGLIFELFDL